MWIIENAHNFQAETRQKTDRNRWVPLRVEAWLGFIFLSHDFVTFWPWTHGRKRRILSRFVAIDLSHAPQMLALPATSCVLTFPPPPFFVFQSRTEHTQHHIFYSAHTHIYIYIFPPFFSFLKDQSSRGFIGNRERIIASPFLFFFFFFSLSFESRHASPSLQSDGSDGSNDPEYLNTLFDQREASFLPASDIYIYLYDFLFILFYLLLFLSISHLFFFVFLFWYSSHDASLHSRGIFFFKSILIFSSNTPGG